VSTKKSILLLALAMAVLGIGAFALMAVKDQTYVPSDAYAPVGEPDRTVAVVYYSRSGHSEAVAREIAGSSRQRSMRLRGGSRRAGAASLSTSSCAAAAPAGRRAGRIRWLRLARECAISGDVAAPL
jgi:hypothetical protein